jgi:hypothetical protein
MHAGLAKQTFLPSQVQKMADCESVVVIAKLRAAKVRVCNSLLDNVAAL